MNFLNKKIKLKTTKQFELVDITQEIKEILAESRLQSGIASIYSPHTTAGIRINHDESLLTQDIMKNLYSLVPLDQNYNHDLFEVRENVSVDERSNGHAHVKAFLLGNSETVPFQDGEIQLGEKQSVFFVELDGGRSRECIISLIGE